MGSYKIEQEGYGPENPLTLQLVYPGRGWAAWSTWQYQRTGVLRTTLVLQGKNQTLG